MAFNDKELEIIQAGVQSGKNRQEVTDALVRFRTGVVPTAPAPVEPTPTVRDTARDVGVGFAKGAGETLNFLQNLNPANQALQAVGAQSQFFSDDQLKANNPAQLVGKGVQMGVEALVPAGLLTKAGVKAARPLVDDIAARSKGIITRPSKDLQGTVGEVIQGKSDDIEPALRAFSSVDTQGVTTYKELSTRLDETVTKLSDEMDVLLSREARTFTPDTAAIRTATEDGTTVFQSPVDDALSQLQTFYQKTNDPLKAQQIQTIVNKYQSQGLSLGEINDIAKLHGRELSAFNANGKLASGLSKQSAENTRKGVKNVVRQSLEGDEAKALDSQMSDLFTVRDLVDKNVEKVATLEQRIQERGLLEKIGHGAAKTLDVLSGGTIRGVVGGLLPRGVGHKTMNALDLQDNLRKNLDLIDEALKKDTDDALIDAAKKLNTAPASSADDLFEKRGMGERITTALKDNRGALNPNRSISGSPFGSSTNFNKLSPKGETVVSQFIRHVKGDKKLGTSELRSVLSDIQTIADNAGVARRGNETNQQLAKALAAKYGIPF